MVYKEIPEHIQRIFGNESPKDFLYDKDKPLLNMSEEFDMKRLENWEWTEALPPELEKTIGSLIKRVAKEAIVNFIEELQFAIGVDGKGNAKLLAWIDDEEYEGDVIDMQLDVDCLQVSSDKEKDALIKSINKLSNKKIRMVKKQQKEEEKEWVGICSKVIKQNKERANVQS